jgi:hypothetical protein
MKDEEEDDKDIDEEEEVESEALKRLEESFLGEIKERKYEIEPNIINADYCMKRLAREQEDFDLDSVYSDVSEYMVYSEKQVRIRYLVELKFI